MPTEHELVNSAEKHSVYGHDLLHSSGMLALERSVTKHVSEFQRMVNATHFSQLLRISEQQMLAGKPELKLVLGVQAAAERSRNFAEICIQLKWPPPWHLPTTVIDEITSAYQAGKLTQKEAKAIFVSFYTPERIKEFGHRWASYGWLSHRLPILQEAIENHIAGRHHSSVCVLLPQIDGVLRETLGAKPTRENIVEVIRGYHLATAAGRFFREVVLETFDPNSQAPVPELSRHAILHGVATDYGTTTHSLKLMLIADIVFSSIEKYRESPVDTNPSVID